MKFSEYTNKYNVEIIEPKNIIREEHPEMINESDRLTLKRGLLDSKSEDIMKMAISATLEKVYIKSIEMYKKDLHYERNSRI